MPRKEETFTVIGRVIDRITRKGIPNLQVEAWDADLIKKDDFVGSDRTDEDGKFLIEFTSSFFRGFFFDRKPDLYFKVLSGKEVIANTLDSVLWNVRSGETTVEIPVPWSKPAPPSQPPDTIDETAPDFGPTKTIANLFNQNVRLAKEAKQKIAQKFGKENLEVRDLVALDAKDWTELIKELSVPVPEKLSHEEYAARLTKQIANWYPTAAMFHRLKPVPADHIQSRIEELRPLITRKEDGFRKPNFDEIEAEGIGNQELDLLKSAHAELSRLVNRYAGLGLGAVLDDAQLSSVEKAAKINERIGWLEKVRQDKPNVEFLALDYTPDSADQKELSFAGLAPDDQKMVRATLKTYQRTIALTGDTEHASALLDAGYNSAARIMRDKFDAFVSKTGLKGPDARKYFDKAEASAAKVSLLMSTIVDQQKDDFNALKVGNDSSSIKDHLKKLDGYADLFGSQSYCQCEHCQSILGPAAYFVDLMRFVEDHILDEYFSGPRSTHRLNLKHTRRPDLWDMVLSCENTNKEIPTLDVINGILENAIAAPRDSNVTVENQVYKDTLSSARDGAFAQSVKSFRQPFSLPLKRLDTYLKHFERTRATVARTVGASTGATTTAQLGISQADYDLIITGNVALSFLRTLYGIAFQIKTDDIVEPFDAHRLLKPMGFSRAELGDLLATTFVRKGDLAMALRAEKTNPESVQNDIERVHNLTLAALDRMHRFVRLWRQLKWQRTGEKESTSWTIPELDLVLAQLNGTIDAAALDHLATLLFLQERFGTSVEELCAMWSDIPNTSVLENQEPLFDRLFNPPSFVKLDGEFPKGIRFIHPSLREAPLPVNNALLRLLGGLRVNDEDLAALITNLSGTLEENANGFVLNRTNLSLLYRHARLAEWLALSISQLFQLIILVGLPIKHVFSVGDIMSLLDAHDWLKRTDYTLDDLSFITGGPVTAANEYPKSEVIADEIRKAITDERALVFVDTLFAVTSEKDITEEQSREIIKANEAIVDPRLIEALDGTGFRLAPTFTAARIKVPADVPADTITKAEIGKVFEKYHASKIIPARLAGKLGIPQEKISALFDLLAPAADLSQPDLSVALQGGNANPLVILIGSVLPLCVLFRNQVFDPAALNFIKDAKQTFGIDSFSEINLSSIRKVSIYKSFVDTSDAAKFSSTEPQVAASDVHDLVKGFRPQTGFVNNADPQARLTDVAKLARVLGAEPGLVATLHGHMSLPQIALEALEKLSRCVELAKHLGVSGETLKLIVSDEYDGLNQASEGILSAFRAKYADETEREKKLEPYEDIIRSAKRAALVDYLIHNESIYFKTPNDLYSYYLIDVQLEGCARTTQMVAAISSLQLYVHRVLMNLEQDRRELRDPDRILVQLKPEYQDEWSWRKNYRVWEANRKVFLYPENYIEPELRDDKTPLFEELESTLLQQEINEQTVLDAYAKYMSGFEEVARLKIAGAYHDRGSDDDHDTVPKSDLLHLFGVTPSDPPIYYYRTVENIHHSQSVDGNDLGIVWNSWRKIDVQIPVRKVSPVVFRGKLYVFWVEFVTTPITKMIGGESQFNGYKHKMSLKFTSLRLDGTWTAPQPIALPASRRGEDAPEGQRIRESYWFPFRGDAAVIPDPLFDVDQRGNHRHVPRYASDNLRHNEAKDEYTLSGFLWDRVYPSAFRYELNIVGANHSLRHSVDFYRRTLLETNARPRQVSEGGRAVYYGTPSGSFRELYRGVFTNGDSPINQWGYGSSSQLFGYGFASLILDSERLDEWGRLRFGDEDTTSFRVSRWLGGIRIATLPLESTLEALNSSEPISDFLVDANGDLFLLQGAVLEMPLFLLRRIGTTLAETVSEALSFGGVDGLLSIDQQQALTEAVIPFTELVDVEDRTNAGLDFTGSYGVYYREIFFHIPYLIANHLNAKQRFAASQRWYHYIFNPTAAETINEDLGPTDLEQAKRDRNWRYLEFRNQDLPKLRAMLTGEEANAAIEVYKKDPFNPHAIARLRISAYQKNIVMKYIDNLLDWGDSLFAQFTRESINEATLLYVMAQDILGERPVELGECGEGTARPRYKDIVDEVREGSDFLAEVESYYWSASPIITSIPKDERAERSMSADRQRAWKETGSLTDAGPEKNKASTGKYDPYGWNKTRTSSWQSKKVDQWGKKDVSRGSDHGSPLIGNFGRARGFALSLVSQVGPLFCVPANKELRSYWDRVEDRLYKIRHCLDISGVRRELALFAPEIDPRMLVKAKAAGLSLEDVLNAVSGNLPPYRFTYLIEKAKSYASTVQSFGNSLLSALEKKDVEELTNLRTVHEQNILKLTSQIRQWEIDTIKEEILSIEKRKASVEYRKSYYQGLIDVDLTPWERTEQISRNTAFTFNGAASLLRSVSGVLFLVPQLGAPPSLNYGGQQMGNNTETFASVMRDFASVAEVVAACAAVEAGFDRRRQDWEHQTKLASRELSEIEKQLAVANLRKQVAEQSLENHNTSVAQQEEIFDFYGAKFSNLGLYTWLSTTLQRLYREAYNSAFGLARLAEQAFKFERGDDDSVSIASDYWDASKAGLLAGDRLLLGLQNLERHFIETNYRNLEVTQSFSLMQINPAALISLRETGSCKFEIPEFFLDLTYPGQYRRLIKAVRLTIPCVTGPYCNVGATLTLTNSKVRKAADLADALVTIPPRRSVSIATSNAQNDAGVFEFNFRDERYMPFEGAGAISDWQLTLPKTFKQFDYQTISDVVLHVSYTADHGGEDFRAGVEEKTAGSLVKYVTENPLVRVFSFRQEFSSVFHKLIHSPVDTKVKVDLNERYFPYFLMGRQFELQAAKLAIRTRSGQTSNNVRISIGENVVPSGGAQFGADSELSDLRATDVKNALGADFVREHEFAIKNGGDLAPSEPPPDESPAIDAEKILDLVLYLQYKVKTAS